MNLCIRVLQHQQQAFMKLLRSWIQSCYARLFLKLFLPNSFSSACLDPLLAHLWQWRQHSLLSDRHPGNQYGTWCFGNSAGLKERAQSLLLWESTREENTEETLWSAYGAQREQALHPSPAAKARGGWFTIEVMIWTHWFVQHGLKDVLSVSAMDRVKSLVH